jgi:hypothetical protein
MTMTSLTVLCVDDCLLTLPRCTGILFAWSTVKDDGPLASGFIIYLDERERRSGHVKSS